MLVLQRALGATPKSDPRPYSHLKGYMWTAFGALIWVRLLGPTSLELQGPKHPEIVACRILMFTWSFGPLLDSVGSCLNQASVQRGPCLRVPLRVWGFRPVCCPLAGPRGLWSWEVGCMSGHDP